MRMDRDKAAAERYGNNSRGLCDWFALKRVSPLHSWQCKSGKSAVQSTSTLQYTAFKMSNRYAKSGIQSLEALSWEISTCSSSENIARSWHNIWQNIFPKILVQSGGTLIDISDRGELKSHKNYYSFLVMLRWT